MTNSNEREITFASSICVYFSSSDIEVKRNERDNILEGIKQINSWIKEGKYTRVSKQQDSVYLKYAVELILYSSAQSIFLCEIFD